MSELCLRIVNHDQVHEAFHWLRLLPHGSCTRAPILSLKDGAIGDEWLCYLLPSAYLGVNLAQRCTEARTARCGLQFVSQPKPASQRLQATKSPPGSDAVLCLCQWGVKYTTVPNSKSLSAFDYTKPVGSCMV